MVLYQFQQAGNEEFQSRKKIGKKIANCQMQDAGCRMQGTVANGTVAAGSSNGEQRISLRHSEFSQTQCNFRSAIFSL